MKALIDYCSIKMINDDGEIVSVENIEFKEPEEDRLPHKAGTSWHPILQRYLPDSIVNKEMLVDESELFPKESDLEEVDNPADSYVQDEVEKLKEKYSLKSSGLSKESAGFVFEIHMSNGEAKAMSAFSELLRELGIVKDGEPVSPGSKGDNYTILSVCDDMDEDAVQGYYVAIFNPSHGQAHGQ